MTFIILTKYSYNDKIAISNQRGKMKENNFGNYIITFLSGSTIDSIEIADCWNEDEAENKFWEFYSHAEIISIEFLG